MSSDIKLKRGDVFCVSGNMGILSKIINMTQRFWSYDNASKYAHAGIIVDKTGKTLEVLWKVSESSLDNYIGKNIIIARPKQNITTEERIYKDTIEAGLKDVYERAGDIYPVWRLVLNLVPPLAKYISSGKFLVCSELQAYYLAKIGAGYNKYTGISPDILADRYSTWRNFEVIYEGVWNGNL